MGVKSNVAKEQTATGIKDGHTQFWIEQLLSRSQELKVLHKSPKQIEEELSHWVDEKMPVIRNEIFNMKGTHLYFTSTDHQLIRLPGFDPTQDSPVEILHTILLGVVKYVWHLSHTKWTDKQKQTYTTRLRATSINGLSIPPIRPGYIMQYAGSLIGRQLKALGQTTVFLTYDICDSRMFSLWKAVGELMALLWIPEISDLEEYLVR